MLYKVVLTYEYANENVAIQVKVTEQFRIVYSSSHIHKLERPCRAL